VPQKTYTFKTGVEDFLDFTGTPGNIGPYDWGFVSRAGTAGSSFTYPTGETTYQNVKEAFDSAYLNDSDLKNQVKAIGFGWQKWIVPRNMNAEVMVRGACGGHTASTLAVLDQSTGIYSNAVGFRGGRGAKLIGKLKLNKGDILYILVGIRGWGLSASASGHGGGASAIFRETPLGQYTFTPTNKKVDVLFVAGGGGGARVSGVIHPEGYDASYSNGTNTLGGLIEYDEENNRGSCGGAGLTGNSVSITAAPKTAYNLLSGTPSSTVNSRILQGVTDAGTWGGGGAEYYGGGGGGGYSGGNVSYNEGGGGGTSYMNPAYVTEVFRGYETNAAMNPYSIPGSVIITGGRDDVEEILARDSEGNKYWDKNVGQWLLLPLNPQGDILPSNFIDYGWSESYDNFNGLVPGDVTFYCRTPYTTKNLTISGLARYQVVKSTTELNMTQLDVIKQWNTVNLNNSVTIKIAVSADSGITYKILSNYNWTTINIDDRDLFWAQGIPLTDLNTIPSAKWLELGARGLRIAFIIQQNYTYLPPVLTSIQMVADLVGAWRKAVHGSQYDYEYLANDLAKITFNQAGSYKVNYLDKVITEND